MSESAHSDVDEMQYGSDVVVAMLRALGIEYAALNPGASFRGIHDSIVNWGSNRAPELIDCSHEEIAVALAHGYAVSSGKPMAALVHDVVGLQHASIAIYHAWLDRAPVLVLGGTGPMDTTKRRPNIDWIHTALVQGNLVRDFTKWDDQPGSAQAVPNSLIRAQQVATSAPAGPVYVCFDVSLQEEPLAEPVKIPDMQEHPRPTRLHADVDALSDLADRLVAAKNPVLIAEYAGRYPGASDALIELAELLGAPVLGKAGRFNIASNHPLHVIGDAEDLIAGADVVLAVEVADLFGYLYTGPKRKPAPGPKLSAWLAHITLGDVAIKAWPQDFQELVPMDCEIRAEAGTALSLLLSMCKERVGEAGSVGSATRRADIEERSRNFRLASAEKAQAAAANSPISLGHVALCLRAALKPHPWVIAKGTLRGWLWRILDVESADQWVGINAGGGLGNGLGFSLGVALDRRDDDIICVDVQGDGDLLYTPSALKTAAQYQLPLLIVVNNNRSYYNSENHAAEVAKFRGRATDRSGIGTKIDDPRVDFAALARAFGVDAEGPIESPQDLLPALERAARKVREERRPVLVDVVCATA